MKYMDRLLIVLLLAGLIMLIRFGCQRVTIYMEYFKSVHVASSKQALKNSNKLETLTNNDYESEYMFEDYITTQVSRD